MKKITVTFLFALICITINAQVEQVYKPIIMQLEDGSGVKEYVVSNYSYHLYSYSDTTRNISIAMTLETQLDDNLTKWIADIGVEKNGKILIKDKKTGEIIKEFSFKGAKMNSLSESSYSEGSYEQYNYPTMQISVKEYSINGIEVKNIINEY